MWISPQLDPSPSAHWRRLQPRDAKLPLLSGLAGRDSRRHSGNASRQSVTPDDAAAVPYRLVYRSWFASISDCGNGEISPISFA